MTMFAISHGELIPVDDSKHWWFEARGPQSTLLVHMYDATSELMHLKMVESESTFAYMDATREYIERHGMPVALYSNKRTVFRNPRASALGYGGRPPLSGRRTAAAKDRESGPRFAPVQAPASCSPA